MNHVRILSALKRLRGREIMIPLGLTGAHYAASQRTFDFIRNEGLDRQVFYLGLLRLTTLSPCIRRAAL
jgi:hypothetical protein